MEQPFVLTDGNGRLRAWAEASGYRQAICAQVDVRIVTDPYPDLSYLERDDTEAPMAERRAQHGVTWKMVGVLAVAHI